MRFPQGCAWPSHKGVAHPFAASLSGLMGCRSGQYRKRSFLFPVGRFARFASGYFIVQEQGLRKWLRTGSFLCSAIAKWAEPGPASGSAPAAGAPRPARQGGRDRRSSSGVLSGTVAPPESDARRPGSTIRNKQLVCFFVAWALRMFESNLRGGLPGGAIWQALGRVNPLFASAFRHAKRAGSRRVRIPPLKRALRQKKAASRAAGGNHRHAPAEIADEKFLNVGPVSKTAIREEPRRMELRRRVVRLCANMITNLSQAWWRGPPK